MVPPVRHHLDHLARLGLHLLRSSPMFEDCSDTFSTMLDVVFLNPAVNLHEEVKLVGVVRRLWTVVWVPDILGRLE